MGQKLREHITKESHKGARAMNKDTLKFSRATKYGTETLTLHIAQSGARKLFRTVRITSANGAENEQVKR